MPWVVLALAMTAACNRVLGLDEVALVDARYFDAELDAAHLACPALGQPPAYSPILHRVIVQDCTDYTASATAGIAIAECAGSPMDSYHLYEGPIDQPLAPLDGFPMTSADVSLTQPRISPEGDFLMVTMFDLGPTMSTYLTYVRTGDRVWTRGPDANLPQFGATSTPSRAPDRHVLFYQGSETIQEWHDNGTSTWSHVRDLDLGAGRWVRNAWLSPDGLRSVLAINPSGGLEFHLEYMDRTAITDPFGAPVPIELAATYDTFITEDCTRAYMSGIQSVFYARQK